MTKKELAKKIKGFIAQKKETEFWDFKQEWHENIADLIKDIICFSNTSHSKDCYLIFGVSDNFEITGMEQERKKQCDILDTLSNLHFSGGIRPKIELTTIILNKKEIDVLTIFNEPHTPIFLEKNYGKMHADCVYTREMDRNTPDNKKASRLEIENLWKKNFNLTNPPSIHIFDLLENKEEWECFKDTYYNKFQPEYSLQIEDDESKKTDEFYFHTQTDSSPSYSKVYLKYQVQIIEEFLLAQLDGARLTIPVPESGILKNNNFDNNYCYKYYIKNSNRWKLINFFYDFIDYEQNEIFKKFIQVIPVFNTENEKELFEHFILNNIKEIDKRLKNSKDFMKENEMVQKEFCLGNILKDMLENDFQRSRGLDCHVAKQL